jgi:nicotinate-nucleotide pyrophosphorylase (carboxylating)
LYRYRALRTGAPVQIKVESLDQLKKALDVGAESILLDNFSPPLMRAAVSQAAGRAALETSGGISLTTLREISETGVDPISIGGLTKDVRATDYSMRFAD